MFHFSMPPIPDNYKLSIDIIFLALFSIQILWNFFYLIKLVISYYKFLREKKLAEQEGGPVMSSLGEKITLTVIILITVSLICKMNMMIVE